MPLFPLPEPHIKNIIIATMIMAQIHSEFELLFPHPFDWHPVQAQQHGLVKYIESFLLSSIVYFDKIFKVIINTYSIF